MTPTVVLLVLAGAVAHATWNVAVKRAAVGGPAFVWLAALGSALLLAPAAVVVAVLDPPDLRSLAVAVAVSGALHAAYFLALQAGYRAGDVSVVYPLARGSGPLLAVVGAIALLGERPGPLALAGTAAIVAGVVVIGSAGATVDRRRMRAGVLWGILVGVVIAAYTLWDGAAVTALGLAPVLVHGGATAVQAGLLAPIALRDRERVATVWRRHRREVILVAVLSPASYLLILAAMQQAPVSLVAPAREVSVVLVALAGWLLLREPHPARRLLGAAVVVVGVALLAASR